MGSMGPFPRAKADSHEADCLCLSSATVERLKMCIWSSINIYVMALNCVPELHTNMSLRALSTHL